jgi:hypothetical protein
VLEKNGPMLGCSLPRPMRRRLRNRLQTVSVLYANGSTVTIATPIIFSSTYLEDLIPKTRTKS